MSDPNYRRERLKYREMRDSTLPPPKQDKEHKVSLTHGESPGKSSFITTIERRRRRRRYGDLNDEDRDDLARYFGSSGEGVSKVDEQTFYYQDGSWH